MKRKLLVLGMAIVMVFGATSMTFASSTISNLDTSTEGKGNESMTRSSKDKVVKEFVNTDSGTAYSDDKKKKVT